MHIMHDLALQNGDYELAEKLRGYKNKYMEFEYNRPENVLARQQAARQQAAAQQQPAQQKQGHGGVFSAGFSGRHGIKHKSPRRKNKTRKSRKVHRLYKSRNCCR